VTQTCHTSRGSVLGVLALLAPPTCLVCRAPAARGAALCPPCDAALPWIDAACPRCALPRCRSCPHARAAFDGAYAPMAHAGVARDLLLALKLRRAPPAADAMAGHMRARAPAEVLAAATFVPIPSWAAERLAISLGRAVRRPVVRCLQPTSPTRQLGRTRTGRRGRPGLRASGDAPPPGPLVLVDDVHTTGATLESGARALRAEGCAQIAAVTYVRTLTSA
jgi:predicted amidophosphoribosyltransferase